jgi:ureidoacrylate peracid hydrolase
MVDFAVIPERTALLNIDLQNLFVEGYQASAPNGLVTLGRINQLAAVCRDAGVLVIHVSHVLRPDGSNMGVLGELHPEVRAGILRQDGTPAALHRDLVVGPSDLLLEKPRYGAFHGTDLELILRSRTIDTVIIAGIATNICCDTTAREAAVRDFRVLFLSDGTATSGSAGISPEAIHSTTLATLHESFGQVLSVDETIGKIRSAGMAAATQCSDVKGGAIEAVSA